MVTKTASIAFEKPARGKITARGTLAEPASALLERLGRDGKVTFSVTVSLTDEANIEVATMTVEWHARRNTA